MRADRLISILLLLQIYQRMTAAELAERLEVSERTIYRDMEALGAAGVPVVAERGKNGGWSLMGGYRTQLTGLREPEVQTLFLSVPPQVLADLGWKEGTEQGAYVKLLAALPAEFRRVGEQVRQRIYVDQPGWHEGREDIPLFSVLQEAIWKERRMRMIYRRGDGTKVERTVDPLGLVVKGRTWYLVAHTDDGFRSYRASRILEATVTPEAFIRPADFDLAAYWKKSQAAFISGLRQYRCRIRIHPNALAHIRRLPYEMKGDSHGWKVVEVRYDCEEDACVHLVALADRVVVEEPASLRKMLIQHAEKILSVYQP
ncbi:helix-turn-helix transcriptional regulator [Desmospora activa]|uniref:Putative DNA-binding transcriptional regulator YafY n=1 Tax=Desmospora activa DSM 45169 TaxID=1121389 RepID=A0A2T4Z6Y3_9BACL|nr:YafY family protein [Desmospora activa]PTM57654.1 putative DNA-binding transcriptional regulator YafY [Desmospora activa DSM 45169]